MLKSSHEKTDCCELQQLKKLCGRGMWEAQNLNEGKEHSRKARQPQSFRRKISQTKIEGKCLRGEVDRVVKS